LAAGFGSTLLTGWCSVFTVTAWADIGRAYDQATAWNKAWLIVTRRPAVFLPEGTAKQNLFGVSVFFVLPWRWDFTLLFSDA